MHDRQSAHPGRIRLTPVSGQANTYDLARADDPLTEGTPLCKASLLKDSTAAALGLTGNDPTPDDALNALLARELVLTLPRSGWANKEQTVSAVGITADSKVIVCPAPESFVAYGKAGVFCSAQSAGQLTFASAKTPAADIVMHILIER